MNNNNSRDDGKISAGLDEAYDLGAERYYDLLREAEESRRFDAEPRAGSNARPSVLKALGHFVANLLWQRQARRNVA